MTLNDHDLRSRLIIRALQLRRATVPDTTWTRVELHEALIRSHRAIAAELRSSERRGGLDADHRAADWEAEP